jgi:hypothetical protein
MLLKSAIAMLTLAGQPADASITKELTLIEQQLTDAYKNGKCDAWGAFLAPEWSVIHITGATITRDEALATCRKPTAPIESATIEVMSVRSYGDFAVVTGRTTFVVGGSSPLTVRFTDVFVRRDGRWQVVASHATGMPL